jgi:hypothetical protein
MSLVKLQRGAGVDDRTRFCLVQEIVHLQGGRHDNDISSEGLGSGQPSYELCNRFLGGLTGKNLDFSVTNRSIVGMVNAYEYESPQNKPDRSISMFHQNPLGTVFHPSVAGTLRMATGPLLAMLLGAIPLIAQTQPVGMMAKKFPLLKNAQSVRYDDEDRKIRFKTSSSIAAVGAFYKKEMKKLGWKEGFQSLASSFGSLDYEKGENEIEIDLDEEDGVVEVTIEGNGLFWSELEMRAADPKLRLTFKGFDFPLLDSQATSKDGSMEIIQFNSRKSVKENIDFYTDKLTSDGWKTKGATEKDGIHSLRFEKGGLYVRMGMWPHSFSDNAGSYDGTKGAIEGTALIWGDLAPSGNVPGRMLRDYERSLGELSAEKRKAFKEAVRQAREKIMTGGGDDR